MVKGRFTRFTTHGCACSPWVLVLASTMNLEVVRLIGEVDLLVFTTHGFASSPWVLVLASTMKLGMG